MCHALCRASRIQMRYSLSSSKLKSSRKDKWVSENIRQWANFWVEIDNTAGLLGKVKSFLTSQKKKRFTEEIAIWTNVNSIIRNWSENIYTKGENPLSTACIKSFALVPAGGWWELIVFVSQPKPPAGGAMQKTAHHIAFIMEKLCTYDVSLVGQLVSDSTLTPATCCKNK